MRRLVASASAIRDSPPGSSGSRFTHLDAASKSVGEVAPPSAVEAVVHPVA